MGAELDTARCEELRSALSSRLHLCSFDELQVIDVVLGRLELGRQRYGYLDLARDDRDLELEEAEEHIDARVYRACKTIRDRGDGGQR